MVIRPHRDCHTVAQKPSGAAGPGSATPTIVIPRFRAAKPSPVPATAEHKHHASGVPAATMCCMPNPPIYALAVTEAVANVLAQTEYPGMSGSELLAALKHARVFELEDGPNKRTRLLHTLHNTQVRRGDGATLVVFVRAAMDQGRYVGDHGRFHSLRDQLNEVLVLDGLGVNDEGKLVRAKERARTLADAAELSGTLHSELRRRGCHPQLIAYCREELIAKSLFHALSEAAKSIPDRIRSMTGIPLDGAELYDDVFGTKAKPPRVTINALATPSEDSEHKGFKNLLVGIHGHYRNPRAHSTRLGSAEDRADFYDAFALFSYVHRRLDNATTTA